MAADGVKGLLADPEDPYGVGAPSVTGTGLGIGDDKGEIDGVLPCGDGKVANGEEVVLTVPMGKPGQRPQYSWQYALQVCKSSVICNAAFNLVPSAPLSDCQDSAC